MRESTLRKHGVHYAAAAEAQSVASSDTVTGIFLSWGYLQTGS